MLKPSHASRAFRRALRTKAEDVWEQETFLATAGT